ARNDGAAPSSEAVPLAAAGSEGGSWLWISAGIVGLIIGAWVVAVSGSESRAAEGVSADQPHEGGPGVAELPDPSVAAEPKPVAVRVFSDVQGATLLVNGEARGALASGEGRNMELRPGAYRFEAQSNGNIAAVEVVTVRPDVPLDVYLKLPSGAADPNAAEK